MYTDRHVKLKGVSIVGKNRVFEHGPDFELLADEDTPHVPIRNAVLVRCKQKGCRSCPDQEKRWSGWLQLESDVVRCD